MFSTKEILMFVMFVIQCAFGTATYLQHNKIESLNRSIVSISEDNKVLAAKIDSTHDKTKNSVKVLGDGLVQLAKHVEKVQVEITKKPKAVAQQPCKQVLRRIDDSGWLHYEWDC